MEMTINNMGRQSEDTWRKKTNHAGSHLSEEKKMMEGPPLYRHQILHE
jgi:hypothetical protein